MKFKFHHIYIFGLQEWLEDHIKSVISSTVALLDSMRIVCLEGRQFPLLLKLETGIKSILSICSVF